MDRNREKEKRKSREQDASDLSKGNKTREQLREENGHFSQFKARPNYKAAKRLY